MAVAGERVERRWASATGIYGLVSICLVIVAWESDNGDRWDLPVLILSYILLLLLTHTYAEYAASGTEGSWTRALVSELPVAAGGIPALIVSFFAALADATDDVASGLALVACGLTLLAMQIAIIRPTGASRTQIVRTVVFDLVAGGLVVFLHIVIE
jgi:hypothetical protein